MKNIIKDWLLPPALLNAVMDTGAAIQLFTGHSAADRRLLKESFSLKDSHAGKRCFILGAGSSVVSQDLKKLHGEHVISVSNTFVHPDFGYIQPRYHVVPSMLQSHGKLYEQERFVVWLREMEASTPGSEMVFHIGDREMIESHGLFIGRHIHWVRYARCVRYESAPIRPDRIPPVWSVSELAITMAVYMGYERIYLLGIDHDWFNGPLVYFYDHNTQHAVKPDAKKLDFADSEFQMRRHADIFRRYKYLQSIRKNIYNANADPRHYLDVFPKVDFDSLFDEKSASNGGSAT